MAYTNPRTWADETVVNADDLNTEIRDNVSALYSMANAPYRNLLYNGAIQVAQRGTSLAGITGTTYNTADRWALEINALGTWTQSVTVDAPTGSGFKKCLKMLCTTADASPAAGDFLRVVQYLEGQDLQRICKGTSSSTSLTISFWVESNKTGTYVCELFDEDNTRQVSATYTISAADTWEYKTITFPADTTGAFDNDNARSLAVSFHLADGSNFTSGTLNTAWAANTSANRAVGQTNLAAATSNYWQVTGVQLETGPIATPFEFVPFGDELARCQRYFYAMAGSASVLYTAIGSGFSTSTSSSEILVPFPVVMRTVPTLGSWSNLRSWDSATALAVTALSTNSNFNAPHMGHLTATNTGALVANRPVFLQGNNSVNALVQFSAEL